MQLFADAKGLFFSAKLLHTVELPGVRLELSPGFVVTRDVGRQDTKA